MKSQFKKINKKYMLYTVLPALLIFLSGCMRLDQETGKPVGWMSNFIYNYLVTPMSAFLDWVAGAVGSYAIALIILTILVRIIIMPLTLNSQASMIENTAKMKHVKPVTDKIQELLRQTNDPAEQQQLQLQQMKVFRKYNIGLGSQLSGCLPLFIQMPVFVAILHVVNASKEIASETFLGIHLGDRSILLAVLVGAVYYIQGKMMVTATDNPQQQQTANSMMLMNPIMFLMISFTSPAGVALYWLIGGILGIIQQYFVTRYYRPKIEARVDEKLKDMPKPDELINIVRKTKQSIAETKQNKNQVKNRNRRRNAGKQDRK